MKQAVKSAEPSFPSGGTNRRALLLATGCFVACVLPAIFAWDLLKGLLALVLTDETYSHIPFVLAVSVFFLVADRRRIFGTPDGRWGMPAAITLAGVAGLVLARANPGHGSESNQISMLVLGFVLLWTGAFGIFFGENSMRAAHFPLFFLWFAIPIPKTALSEMITLLQRGSADAVDVVFRLFHTPVVRQGFDFAFPGITVRVAEECSGIRSTLALVMASVLAGHLWLRSFWRTLFLCLATIPISIFKNALRIAVLSWLAVYVDPRFLTGSIHHQYGGILFFGVGLLLMGIVLALLQRPRLQTSVAKPQIPSS
jgi:exosortase